MFRLSRVLRSKHASVHVDAVVVGAGPSGIAVVGNLLHLLPEQHSQLWADPSFSAGRVNAYYREVPSNTKVELFSKFATSIEPFRHIVESALMPNAFAALSKLPQDQGCDLGRAVDMCLMLSDGLARHYGHRAQRHKGKVTAAFLDKSTNLWNVSLDNSQTATTSRLILCTGSSPKVQTLPIPQTTMAMAKAVNVHLDTALSPSNLARAIPSQPRSTIAVVGASHSAILVLMNLCKLASTTHPNLRIKWFTRHKDLRYAKFMDGWILYDNTGLKGQAAQWARENLEEDVFAHSQVSKMISKIWTPIDAEQDVYQAEIPGCSHLIQAIGYQRDPLPRLSTVDGPGAALVPLCFEHDGLTGRFFSKKAEGSIRHIPGLFGAGIAFPERVTDPAGNMEHAVGFWKFMNFCRRVVPQWVRSPVQLA